MSSSKIKESNLFNIIRTNNINLLTDFFYENPGFNIEHNLKSGRRNRLLTEAIENNSNDCAIFLMTRMNTTQLRDYVSRTIHLFQKCENTVNSFILVSQNKADEENNYRIIEDIVLTITVLHFIIPEYRFTQIIEKNKTHFINLLSSNPESQFKYKLEYYLVRNKITWFNYFIKFYQDNNIDLNQLYSFVILYGHNHLSEKHKIVIKHFKNIGFDTKIHLYNCHDDLKSKYQYSILFFFIITDKFDLLKIKLPTDFSFESEFLNMFNEDNQIFDLYSNIFRNFVQCHYDLLGDKIGYCFLFGYNQWHSEAQYQYMIKFQKIVKFYSPAVFDKFNLINDLIEKKKKDKYLNYNSHINEYYQTNKKHIDELIVLFNQI